MARQIIRVEPLSTYLERWKAPKEHAAIVQFDGNIPREWAEGFARLDPDNPPGNVPPQRWLRFVDDIGLFLDSPFCATAAALGWGPYDLFGCDCDRPFARIDHLGGSSWRERGADAPSHGFRGPSPSARRMLWIGTGPEVVSLTLDNCRLSAIAPL